jgi:hypothetical protein
MNSVEVVILGSDDREWLTGLALYMAVLGVIIFVQLVSQNHRAFYKTRESSD